MSPVRTKHVFVDVSDYAPAIYSTLIKIGIGYLTDLIPIGVCLPAVNNNEVDLT